MRAKPKLQVGLFTPPVGPQKINWCRGMQDGLFDSEPVAEVFLPSEWPEITMQEWFENYASVLELVGQVLIPAEQVGGSSTD